MHSLEIVTAALALSMDAFAVCLAASIAGHVTSKRAVFRLSFHFGLFQFLMPILGWTLGNTIAPGVAAFDHWVAFALLSGVGVHMIHAGVNPDATTPTGDPSRGMLLVVLSTATSIDALAVGLSLAMLRITVWYPSVVIGIVTAGTCLIGILVGSRVGPWFGKWAQVIGGAILLLIAIKIIGSHMT